MMSSCCSGGHGSRKCKGAILLVFGVLFLLGTLGVWPEFTFAKYWPVVLIVVGLHKLFCSCGNKMSCGCEGGKCECDMPMKMKR